MASALEQPPPRMNQWWPVYNKVWAAIGGAAIASSAAVLALSHPIAILARDLLALTDEGTASAEQIVTVLLTMIGVAIAGYFTPEPRRR